MITTRASRTATVLTAIAATLALLSTLLTSHTTRLTDTRAGITARAAAAPAPTAAPRATGTDTDLTADPDGTPDRAGWHRAGLEPRPSTATVLRLSRRAARGLVDITTSTDTGPLKAGTGIVIDTAGDVLTNDHVIAGGSGFRVYDHGSAATYDATLIGADPRHDIAVLHLTGGEHLPTARLAPSRHARLGQEVISVGNAYGAGTLRAAAGPITALHTSITSTTEHTDTSGQDDSSQGDSAADSAADGGVGESAAPRLTGLIRARTSIVPGDSGGAMLDMTGAVIGMNVACDIDPTTGTPIGTGYAIPIATALTAAHRLLRAAADAAA